MCQMNVLLERDGEQEKVMEDVTRLEVTADGVVVSSLFADRKLVSGARVHTIDFMDNTVTLTAVRTTEE